MARSHLCQTEQDHSAKNRGHIEAHLVCYICQRVWPITELQFCPTDCSYHENFIKHAPDLKALSHISSREKSHLPSIHCILGSVLYGWAWLFPLVSLFE